MATRPDRRAHDDPRSEEQRQAIVVAALASLVLHYPLLQAALAVVGAERPPERYEPIAITEVELLDGLDLSEEMDQAARDRAKERLEEEKRKAKEPEDELDGQVVSVPAPKRATERPKDARYLARYDNATERETKRKGDPKAGGPQQVATPMVEQGREGIEPLDALRAAIRPPDARESEDEPRKERTEDAEKRDAAQRFSVIRRDEAPLELAPEGSPGPSRRDRRGPEGPPTYEALLPPLVGMGGGPGVKGTDDWLPEVEEGDETALNTRRFRYWSFFERVKESLKRNWRPAQEFRRADPTGRVYGVRDRMTVLSVVLNADGSLSGLRILAESGVGPLDEEAVRAFHAAQPFPNPPGGLVGEDGHIQFTYALILDIESGWDFRPLRLPAYP